MAKYFEDDEDFEPKAKGKTAVAEDEEEEEAPRAKKSRPAVEEDEEEERPRRKRQVEEDEEEEAPKPKKRQVVEEDEDEEPRPKKKRVVEEDEDEDPKPKKKAKPVVDDEEEEDEDDSFSMEIDYGDEKVMYRNRGLIKLKPPEGRAVRFALIPGYKPIGQMVHYIDGKGTYRCLSTEDHQAICCKKLGESDINIVAPVVHYTNANKEGKYPKDKTIELECELKYLKMSRKNYATISKLATEDESPTDFDITMSHNTNGIGWEFHKVSNSARWQANKELKAEMLAEAEKKGNKKEMAKKLGKKVNLLEFKALIASLTEKAEDADMEDIEEL